ncbi:hypothetical protein SAY87_023196 [Trapa incisa]|uniref:Uncharacterized protein n=1 Tax=Trapa incisa TaxID=236973 RepID=A0AAN7K3X1_9MYRT|nr:hypothetical protein SAY87_023196 [Trapa incisa]
MESQRIEIGKREGASIPSHPRPLKPDRCPKLETAAMVCEASSSHGNGWVFTSAVILAERETMRSSSFCLVFFLVLIFSAASCNCRVATMDGSKKLQSNKDCAIVYSQCKAHSCDSSCKADWGTQTTGFCDTTRTTTGTCMCKLGSSCN